MAEVGRCLAVPGVCPTGCFGTVFRRLPAGPVVCAEGALACQPHPQCIAGQGGGPCHPAAPSPRRRAQILGCRLPAVTCSGPPMPLLHPSPSSGTSWGLLWEPRCGACGAEPCGMTTCPPRCSKAESGEQAGPILPFRGTQAAASAPPGGTRALSRDSPEGPSG